MPHHLVCAEKFTLPYLTLLVSSPNQFENLENATLLEKSLPKPAAARRRRLSRVSLASADVNPPAVYPVPYTLLEGKTSASAAVERLGGASASWSSPVTCSAVAEVRWTPREPAELDRELATRTPAELDRELARRTRDETPCCLVAPSAFARRAIDTWRCGPV